MKPAFSAGIARVILLALGSALLSFCAPAPPAATVPPTAGTTIVATLPQPSITPTSSATRPEPTSTLKLSPTAVPATRTPTSPPTATLPAIQTATAPALRSISRQPAELRAAWVHDNSLVTRDKVDEIIRRAELGNLNALFANVFANGEALFDSAFVEKSRLVQDEFNPLAYLVQEAHKRDIQVHAWFVNGPVDNDGESAIIAKHPEWALVGADGAKLPWLNFARPDVRQFLGDLMFESVARYGVDGVHFDFTRYPGPQWGFDPYTVQAFNASHDFDASELRYTDLPAYSFFEGNPLTNPTTAQILAAFADGLPAVTLNTYGAGQALVFNWRASERHLAIESEIMRRAVNAMLKPGGKVYLYRTDQGTGNSEDYFMMARAWLRDLGWTPIEIDATKLTSLQPGSVIVMPNVYKLSPSEAGQLGAFVEKGGGAIFIEGPARAMSLEILQQVTGMRDSGNRFAAWTLLVPMGSNSLIPVSARSTDLAAYQARDAQWKTFRKDAVTALIKEAHQRIKGQYPQVELTATMTPDQESAANQVLQDWQTWLDRGLIDWLIPRGYITEASELDPILADWKPAMKHYKRIVIGLSTFYGKGKERIAKEPIALLAEIAQARAAGSAGVILWNLDYSSDEELKALKDGLFRQVQANP